LQSAQAKGPLDEGPIFGGNFTLESGETRDEPVLVFGGSVFIEEGATLNDAVVVFGGSVTVDGEVSKDVVVIGGVVKLGENSHIGGDLVTVGAPLDRAEGARVDGEVVNNPSGGVANLPDWSQSPAAPTLWGEFNPVWNVLGLFGWSVMLALLAMLIVMFLPEQTRRVADTVVTQTMVAGGMGFLTIVLAPAALLVMSITLILLPVAAIAATILAVAVVFGWIAIGLEVGLRFTKMLNRDLPLPLAAGLGTFLLTLVADGIQLVVPCVGWLAPVVIALAGLGAVLMTRFGSRPALLPVTPVPGEPVG
jgi:hypothetical protein